MDVSGNTTGLSASEHRALERLERRQVPFDRLTTPELTKSLCDFSHATRRQVGALINRQGGIESIVVGDAAKLFLPDLGRLRAGEGRFRGLRLVHTHLRHEPLTRDDLVDLTRLRLDVIAAICLSTTGDPQTVYYAHCVPSTDDNPKPFAEYGPTPYARLDCNPAAIMADVERAFAEAARGRRIHAKDGRALLVMVRKRSDTTSTAEAMEELRELARTAGVEVVDEVIQTRDAVDPRYMLGKGKLEDVVIRAMQEDAEVLIFHNNLTPAQTAAISTLTDLKVIDRTQLILDIFAQHAETRDGKLQVELAQMKYLLPRLGLRDDALSRLTGGIGGRGPGETKLEIGKRRAKERVTRLEGELRQLAKQRKQRRGRRTSLGVPVVAIVGYTNAGKSTLLNALTQSDTIAENKLFATLDTRSRRLRFPREREIVISDTVGFIRDLPKDLFAAFRATFEEAQDADLLLHVVDISHPSFREQEAVTEAVLEELELAALPRLTVYNKTDRVSPEHYEGRLQDPNVVALSALDRKTFTPLLARLEVLLFDTPLQISVGDGSDTA